MSWHRVISAAIFSAMLLAVPGCETPNPDWPGEPASPRAEIIVDFTRVDGGSVPVSMRVIGVEKQPYRFRLKADRREVDVQNVRFSDGSGRTIPHSVVANSYTLEPFDGEVVQADWDATPGGLGRHGLQGVIREDFATFDGRLYLIPAVGSGLRAARIHFVVPRGWTVATPFRREGDWYYLDTFEPDHTGRLLEESCVGVGRFDVAQRRVGEMEVRVASYAAWERDYKAEITDSSFRILQYFHDTLDFDLKSPYLVVWTPLVDGYRVHGGSSVNGTCLQNSDGKLRPFQLLSHRLAHSMDKYHPSGMRVSDSSNHWFREGWPSYMEVVATEATGVATGKSYFDWLFGVYKSMRRNDPALDIPLAEESRVAEQAKEFIHYKKSPLVAKMLADLVRYRSDRTMEEFMRAMWAENGWFRGRFNLKQELEAFTGATFDDFWAMAIRVKGDVIPAWDDYLTESIRAAQKRRPAAHLADEHLSGGYLFHLASSGEFSSFGEIREFLESDAARRRELKARGVQLYSEEIESHLFALPAVDRFAIARFVQSYPFAAVPVASDVLRLKPDPNQYDGLVFADLLELDRKYLAAVSRGALSSLELRAVDGPSKGKSRLGFGADASLLLAPNWRSTPRRVEVELMSGDEVTKRWTLRRPEPVRMSPVDRPAHAGIVTVRVTADSGAPVSRSFWQRGFDRNRGRSAGAADPRSGNPQNPQAWFNRGLARSASGEHAQALELFTKSIDLDPDDARKWNKKGETLALLKRHDEAVESFTHALALRPRFTTAAGNKALSLAALGQREESLAALAFLMRNNADLTTRFLWKGRVLQRLGDLEAAESSYRTYAELEPKRAEGWSDLGQCLLQMRRYQEAVAAFDQALVFKPRAEQSVQGRAAAIAALERLKR